MMTPDDFRDSYLVYNGISANRQRDYLTVLKDFDSHFFLDSLNAVSFRAWMGHLLARGENVNTVRKKGNMLRAYAKHCYKMGLFPKDDYDRLKEVENPRGASGWSEPKPYTHDEIKAMYAWIDRTYPRASEITLRRFMAGSASYNRVDEHFMNIQIKAIVALSLDCGMRRVELHHATIDDISAKNENVVVRHGKSIVSGQPRFREVPFTPYARQKVVEWQAARLLVLEHTAQEPTAAAWLVLSAKTRPLSLIGTRLSEDSLGEMLGKGVKGGWNLHRLRHTCATTKLRCGMPIETLQRFLGHSTPQQTLAYAKITPGDIARVSAATDDAFEAMMGDRT